MRTPLYDWHVARQARVVDFAGWEMPIQYTTIIDEHTATRTEAGLFDISHMGRLEISGPDALALLQHVVTNDVSTMKPGQVRYALVCNEQGGILDDVLVYRLEPYWLLVVNASNRDKIVAWLQTQLGGRQVIVRDRTLEWGMLAVQGPNAVQLVQALYPTAPQLKYYFGQVLTQPAFAIVSRTGYTGEDGFELIVPNADLLPLVDRLQTVALQQGGRLTPCGLGCRDTLRLEAAMPLYGHELNESLDPLQAGLGWAVKLDKGAFVGREALLKRQQAGPTRQRVGLMLAGKRIAREGAKVLSADKEIGTLTSGTFSPTLNQVIALAYVDTDHAQVGTECSVDIRGKTAPARVVSLPFYRRKS